MNRILQADVILTLTREQAEQIHAAISGLGSKVMWDEWRELASVVRQQCCKQGVELGSSM